MEENQRQTAKRIKGYVKVTKKAASGNKRARKKLNKMATNDIINVVAKKASNHPEWYTKLGGELIGLNYGSLDQINRRTDLIVGVSGEGINTMTTTDAIVLIALTAPSDESLRVAAQKIVNELRLVSGANTIYTVDDMIDYLLNIRSIWASLTQIRRAIRCLNASDPHDIDAWRKYLLEALFCVDDGGGATGFMEEFRMRAANIVNWLNTVVKSVRFMMPANMSFFERTQWLFTNIFVDGTGDKFGTKMFVAKEVPYYTYTGTTHTGTVQSLFDPRQTVDGLMTTVTNMINAFTTKVENVAIAGDLMKAYGMQAFYNPGQIGYDEKPSFIYDERALEQIANADVVGHWDTVRAYLYTGAGSSFALTFGTPVVSKTDQSAKTSELEVKFVNTEDNVVTPGETLSLTRLKATTVSHYDGNNLVTWMDVVDNGTEVVIDYLYLTEIRVVSTFQVLEVVDPYASNLSNMRFFFSCWSMDDYGPMSLLFDPTASPTNLPGGGNVWDAFPLFDFANWAIMSRSEQRQFHKTAVLSLLTPSASVVQQAVARL